MRRRTIVLVLALIASCSSSEEPPDATTTTTTSTSTSTSTTTSTTTTIPPPPSTTTPPGRAAWPSARTVDDALGLELTVSTSSQDIGPDERATFVFHIRNTSATDDVVYDANTDFISLQGGDGGGHWAPFCGARTAVLVFETLRPGQSLGGHDIAYPGDTGPEPCPRPPAGEYQLVVQVYGCRGPAPSGCDEGSVARVAIPVRQR